MNKRLWILLAAVALCALPMFGQHDVRAIDIDAASGGGGWSGTSDYNDGRYMDNPCTPTQDWVWVNYSAFVSGEQKAAGIDRYLFDESTTMGGAYSASGSSFSDVGYTNTVSMRQYYKVNTPDNFHVVTVITFDPGSQYTTLSVETACGDGSPSSAQ
jgi:hypothetical protein